MYTALYLVFLFCLIVGVIGYAVFAYKLTKNIPIEDRRLP
jgi:ABC-type antimicrobial peptide transport system permease subunit